MNIDAIGATPAAWPAEPALPALPAMDPVAAGAVNFEQMVLGEVAEVNGKLKAADQHLQQLATGDTGSLHDAMLSMEQARLSFQFMAQVRNRFLDAYQQLMQMQI